MTQGVVQFRGDAADIVCHDLQSTACLLVAPLLDSLSGDRVPTVRRLGCSPRSHQFSTGPPLTPIHGATLCKRSTARAAKSTLSNPGEFTFRMVLDLSVATCIDILQEEICGNWDPHRQSFVM